LVGIVRKNEIAFFFFGGSSGVIKDFLGTEHYDRRNSQCDCQQQRSFAAQMASPSGLMVRIEKRTCRA
jgi:hypothetical protein